MYTCTYVYMYAYVYILHVCEYIARHIKHICVSHANMSMCHGTQMHASWETYERAMTHSCVRALLQQQHQKKMIMQVLQSIAAVWRVQMLYFLVQDPVYIGLF